MDTEDSRFERVALAKVRAWKDTRGVEESVEDLLESFGKTVQLQNIVVRPAADDPSEYEIISGNRRVRAARESGWTHIDAKIVSADDSVAERYSLEENLRRKALRFETRAMARLLQLYQLASGNTRPSRGGDRRSKQYLESVANAERSDPSPLERVASIAGESVRNVRRKTVIGLKGTDRLNEAVSHGRVRLTEAERIAALPPEEQHRRLDALEQSRVTPTAPAPERDQTQRRLSRVIGGMRLARTLVAESVPGTFTAAEYRMLTSELHALAVAVRAHEARAAAPEPEVATVPEDAGAAHGNIRFLR